MESNFDTISHQPIFNGKHTRTIIDKRNDTNADTTEMTACIDRLCNYPSIIHVEKIDYDFLYQMQYVVIDTFRVSGEQRMGQIVAKARELEGVITEESEEYIIIIGYSKGTEVSMSEIQLFHDFKDTTKTKDLLWGLGLNPELDLELELTIFRGYKE